MLIHNARIYTPVRVIHNGWLWIENHRIRAIGQGDVPRTEDEKIDARGLNLLPGFIDIHVHGAVGHEFMDANPDGLRAMAQYYAQHGVTAFLPTTWTDSRERILAALHLAVEMMGAQSDGATILGAHIEGPYLNAEKCGAQNSEYIRRAEVEEATAILDTGIVRLMALAPEFEENHWLIRECVHRGITVSAAHTSATYEEMQLAFRLGLSHSTHTFNAMIGLHHRDPGTVGAVMTAPQVMCELIADNIHVHPASMQVLYAVKGANGIVLITDAVRGAGMPDGEYKIDERITRVADDAVRLLDGTLAGSTLTMNRALYHFMNAVHEPLENIWQVSSLNAARAIHVSHQKGSLEVNKDADLVLVDDEINVYLTLAEGRIIYQNDI